MEVDYKEEKEIFVKIWNDGDVVRGKLHLNKDNIEQMHSIQKLVKDIAMRISYELRDKVKENLEYGMQMLLMVKERFADSMDDDDRKKLDETIEKVKSRNFTILNPLSLPDSIFSNPISGISRPRAFRLSQISQLGGHSKVSAPSGSIYREITPS